MNFTEHEIEWAWQQAQIVVGYDLNVWRKDFAGAWIRCHSYGKTDDYGWEIDHKKPIAKGGTGRPDNLWAMHWRNNRAKGDDYPAFKTAVTSNEDKNVEMEIFWTL